MKVYKFDKIIFLVPQFVFNFDFGLPSYFIQMNVDGHVSHSYWMMIVFVMFGLTNHNNNAFISHEFDIPL